MNENTCPDCGSSNAVSKAVAWDAAATIPPKVQKELARLRRIKSAAKELVAHPGDEKTQVISIPVAVFEGIRVALLQDRDEP